MFEAYCDATGMHDDAYLTLVGGYLFTKPAAIEFKSQWVKEVKPLLPPGVDYFHATDCIGGYGKWKVLSQEERDTIVQAMVDITKQTMSYGITVGIPPATYEQVIQKNPQMKNMAGSAYYLCLIRCVEYFSGWLDREKIDGDISYFFEAGDRYAGQAAVFLSKIKTHEELCHRYRLRDYDFPTKRDAPPLQAADLLAWEWQRSYGTAMLSDWKGRPWRRTLASLVEKRHQGELLTETSVGLRAMLNTMSGLCPIELAIQKGD
jgi:hypothetical protein